MSGTELVHSSYVADTTATMIAQKERIAALEQTVADLRAELAAAQKAIVEHNADCASACGDDEQEGVRCGYRKYFPRHCPDCPRGWMIAAREQEGA